MAMTNSERQDAFKERHKDQTKRISMVVDVEAKAALLRLSGCYGMTQRGLLEYLILAAEESVVAALPKPADYHKGRAKLDIAEYEVEMRKIVPVSAVEAKAGVIEPETRNWVKPRRRVHYVKDGSR